MLRINSQFSQVLSVIRCDYDGEIIVINSFLFQCLQNHANLIVCIADTIVIQIDEMIRFRFCANASGMFGVFRIGNIRPHTDFIRPMGSDMKQMFLKYLLCNPVVTKRCSLEGIFIIFRSPVRRVRIPVMNMQHPVILFAVSLDPVQNMRSDHFRRLYPSASHIDTFVESGIKPPCRVSFCKGGKRDRVEPGPPELHKQAVFRHIIGKSPRRALQTHIRSCSPMSYDAVVNSILTADQRRP